MKRLQTLAFALLVLLAQACAAADLAPQSLTFKAFAQGTR
jgi:hypothetical protein